MTSSSTTSSRVALILPMAGRGLRFGGPVAKPYLPLVGRPIFLRTLERFAEIKEIAFRLIAVSPDDLEQVRQTYADELASLKVDMVIAGGSERFETVRLALNNVPQWCDLVAVHDAVRPLVPLKAISEAIQTAERIGAACVGMPLVDTLKRTTDDDIVTETIPRDRLWQIQTPQVFRRAILAAAYERLATVEGPVTDDCRLVEELGHPVAMVAGSRENLKITAPDDLRLAEILLKNMLCA